MATYSDIDATIAGASANSYVTGAEMDTFASFESWEAAWLAKTESERTVAIIQACRWLQTIDYAGTKCTPQPLAWPRSGATCDGLEATCSFIPAEVKQAQCLLAYNLVVNPNLITGQPGGGGSTQAGVYVSKQALGDLIQEFTAFPSGDSGGDSCVDCATPAVIAALPWLRGVLACWADVSTSGSSKILLRVRS